MRVLLAALAVLGGSYFAYHKSFGFGLRERTLKELKRAVGRLENSVCYYRRPLGQALGKLDGEFKDFFAFSAAELDSHKQGLREIWEQAMNANEKFACLTDRDKSVLLDFAALLGQADGQAQKELFCAVMRELDGQISDAAGDVGRKAKLYRVLGFAAGVTLAIIII